MHACIYVCMYILEMGNRNNLRQRLQRKLFLLCNVNVIA